MRVNLFMIQSLARASRAGHRVRVQVICPTLPLDWSGANQSASIPAFSLSYKMDSDLACPTVLGNQRDVSRSF